MANGWTIGTSGGNKVVTQPTIGTSGGNKNATQVWHGTASGNKLVWPIIDMATGTQQDTATSPASAQVVLDIFSTGSYDVTLSTVGGGPSGAWINPTSLASGSYEVRATATSGTVSTGTVGSWLALSSSRTWSVSRSGAGSKACTLLIEIRTEGVTVYSGSITLRATVSL